MYYGNFFVGKLLEAKHLGKGTFTDVGTTYKAVRRDCLKRLLPHLHPEVNLEFNVYIVKPSDVFTLKNQMLNALPLPTQSWVM